MPLRHLVVSTLALVALAPAVAGADTGFSAVLNFGQEVSSPCAPSNATGSGTFVLNNAQTQLSYNISFSGFTTNEIGAHFHNAAAGANGAVVKNLPAGSPKIGVWASTDASQPLTAAMVTELLATRMYVNIHSQACPSGEIRGQVVMDATSARARSWGRIKALYR